MKLSSMTSSLTNLAYITSYVHSLQQFMLLAGLDLLKVR